MTKFLSWTQLLVAVLRLPRREERIGGQTFKYVKLYDVLALIDQGHDDEEYQALAAPVYPTAVHADKPEPVDLMEALRRALPKELAGPVGGARKDVMLQSEQSTDTSCPFCAAGEGPHTLAHEGKP